MINKWKKLSILIQWLKQDRILELENVNYGISEDGNILHMYCENKGVPLPSLKHIWNLLEKIDDDKLFIMSSEVALTNMNKEKAEMRIK